MTQMIIRIRADESKTPIGRELSPAAVTINGQRFTPELAPVLGARGAAAGDRSSESDPVELEIEVS